MRKLMNGLFNVIVSTAILVNPRPAAAQCETWLPGPLIDQPQGFDGNGITSASAIWTPPGGPTLLVVGGDMTSAGGVSMSCAAAWGPYSPPCPPSCPADVNDTCVVNIDDVFAVITGWG